MRAGAAAAATLALLGFAAGCSQHDPRASDSAAAAGPAGAVTLSHDSARGDAMRQDSSGLTATELKAGAGPAIAAGQTAVVQYTGWLYSTGAPDHKGVKFDSSRDRGEPFEFRVGAGDVIAGWDQGVAGMQAGGERRLVIPPELGYGSRGAGGVIPPGATLVFDVELVGIR
jgi:FKBP-type peptidyl-prolyl cis-trans isomerase